MGIEVQLDDIDDGNTTAAIAPRRQHASTRTDIEVSLDDAGEKVRRGLRRLFFHKKRGALKKSANNSSQETTTRDEQLSTSDIMCKSPGNLHNQCRNDTESKSMIDRGDPLQQRPLPVAPTSDCSNPIITTQAYPGDNDNIDDEDGYSSNLTITTYIAFSLVDHYSCSSLSSCSSDDDEDMFSISSRSEGDGESLDYEEQRRIFQDAEPDDEDLEKVDPFVAAIGSMVSSMAWWNTNSKKNNEDEISKKQKRKSKEDKGRQRTSEIRERDQLALASGEFQEEGGEEEKEEDDVQYDNKDVGEKQRRSTARRQRRLQTRGIVVPGAYSEVYIDDEHDDDVEQGGYEAMPANTLLSGDIRDSNGIQTTVIIPFSAEISPEMEDIIAERDSLRMELEDLRQRLKQEQQQRRRK